MDPATISVLAAGVMSALVPFFTKAGEKFSEGVGSKLADRLAKKFENKPEAKKALGKVQDVPDSPRLQGELQGHLEKALAEDAGFAQTLQTLLAEAKPAAGGDHIEIDVKVSGHAQVGDITGKVVGDVNKRNK